MNQSWRSGLFFLLLALATSSWACSSRKPADEIVVFAAASLTDVLEALADAYEASHPGTSVLVNVAGTSLLARQLESGAAADVFLSANAEWMTFLEGRGKLVDNLRVPIGNELVVAIRESDAIDSVSWKNAPRIAIADPQHVPAGIYAREALLCMGLWDSVQDRLAPTLDVRAALQAMLQGVASAAIVYRSDLRAVDGARVFSVLEKNCQPDIQYRIGRLVKATNPAGAREFVSFLFLPENRSIWNRFGFNYTPAN